MASKAKKLLLTLFVVFVAVPVLFTVVALMFGSSDKTVETSGSCETISQEDRQNLSDGMVSSEYTVKTGFTADFEEADVEAIKEVFPTYTSPRIIAASIEGPGGATSTGLWGVQKFDYGWRITALDENTRKFSVLGADLAEGTTTARVNEVMFELSKNTNVLSCLGNP